MKIDKTNKANRVKGAEHKELTQFVVSMPTDWVNKLDEIAKTRYKSRTELVRDILRPVILGEAPAANHMSGVETR